MQNRVIKHDRDNNFGFLRLAMALLVILAHSPELIDANRSREPLTRLFGTISFGDLAVDGFFLISGHLITKSFMNSTSNLDYLWKRILRIYPGFIVASFGSILIGCFGGGSLTPLVLLGALPRALALHPPRFDSAFLGNPLPALNGAMWTVSYEFRCYLIVMLLAAAGLLKRRRLHLALTAAIMVAMISRIDFTSSSVLVATIGQARADFRFTSIFMVGGCAYLFRDRIRYDGKAAIVCAAALIPLMFSHWFCEAALSMLGGYILFWFALKVKAGKISKIGTKVDLSYGIYLYAWPLQSLILWHYRQISAWALTAEAALAASVLAFASWTFVEAPFLKMKGKLFKKEQVRQKQTV